MAELSAKKVMAFVDQIVDEEEHSRATNYWDTDDARQAIFKAVVKWDAMLRKDFTTGMDTT